MAQLKAMINGLSDQKPEKPAPRAEAAPAAETEPAESKKKPSGAPLPAAVFAAVKETAPELQPEPVPQPKKTEQPEKQPVVDFFGKVQSEDAPQAPLAPAEEPAAKEDTMSLPLLPLDGEEPQQAPEKAPAAPQPELKAEAEDAVSPEEHAETELTEPEATADKLHRMSAELTLRCVLGGILAVVLLHFGLVSDGLLPAMAALDPDAAPAAFYAANLLLLAASLCVGFPVLRDGLNGLRGRSSSETMPALAAVAALVQAVTAMLNANVYRGTTGISLLSGMAALGLFLALLGSRVMLAAVKGGYELVTNGVEFEGAYRAKDKDLLRALARDLEQKDPWVLLSRPMKEADGFVEQSLSERASERRARKVSYILLGVALLSGVLFLLATIFSPLFLTIPSFATAPALIIVGFYMMGSAIKIDFNDPSEGIPAFLTILAMPTAYSISEGIAIGIISWTIINVITGKAKEKKISPLMYVLTVLFILKYVCL